MGRDDGIVVNAMRSPGRAVCQRSGTDPRLDGAFRETSASALADAVTRRLRASRDAESRRGDAAATRALVVAGNVMSDSDGARGCVVVAAPMGFPKPRSC